MQQRRCRQALGDVRGKRVLDLARRRGKTLQLAAAGAHVTAVDKSEARLKRLRENLARTKLQAEVICANATSCKAEPFDAILLDAPCTSTGTLRRHPDVAWLRRPTDVRALAELQSQLIAASAKLLKPGAPLIYAVCSLEPEEGSGVVAELCAMVASGCCATRSRRSSSPPTATCVRIPVFGPKSAA